MPLRSPEPVVVVAADRAGQAVGVAEEIDRAGLAVVLGEDARLRPLVRWQRVVDAGDFGNHFRPAMHVRVVLRQRAHLMPLAGAHLDPQGLHIADEGLHRQDRQRERSQGRAPREKKQEDRGSQTPPAHPGFQRRGSGGEERRVGRGEVVRLGALRHQDDENRHVSPAQHPERPPGPREQQPAESREPDRKRERMHLDDLLGKELQRRQRHVLVRGGVADELQRRRAVRRLPDQMRQEEENRDRATQPDPGAAEVPALGSEQQPGEHPAAEEEHAVLVLQAEAADQAEEKPELRIATLDDADHRQSPERPEEDVEGVHRKDVEGKEVDRSDQSAQCREDLGEPPAPQLPGDPSCKKNDRGAGQDRRQAERGQRLPQRLARDPRDQGDQRGMIHVPPGEPLAAGYVVKLIAEPAVGLDRDQVQEDAEERNGRQGGGNLPATKGNRP